MNGYQYPMPNNAIYQQPNNMGVYPPTNEELVRQKLNNITSYNPPQSQFPTYQPINTQPSQPQQLVNQIIGRPVTGIDEAKAAFIDAFNIYLFTDFANGRIYLKQITNSGNAVLQTFALSTPEAPEPDIKTVLAAYQQAINEIGIANQRIERLEKEWRGDVNESVTVNTGATGIK